MSMTDASIYIMSEWIVRKCLHLYCLSKNFPLRKIMKSVNGNGNLLLDDSEQRNGVLLLCTCWNLYVISICLVLLFHSEFTSKSGFLCALWRIAASCRNWKWSRRTQLYVRYYFRGKNISVLDEKENKKNTSIVW